MFTLKGFETVLHEKNGALFRIAGGSLSMSNAKLLGPFRLGFARALIARNVTVEIFRHADSPSTAAALVLPTLSRTITALIPAPLNAPIVQVECGPLKIIQHEETQTTVILEARNCHERWGGKMRCEEGVLRVDGTEKRFHELSYDIHDQIVDSVQPAKEKDEVW